MSSQKIENSDAHSSTAPTNDDQHGNQKQKDTRAKHKGRGAKTRSAEKFRERKNEETYNTRMEANRAFRDSFSSSVDGVESVLKALSVGSPFFQPPSEITVSQSGIIPLVDATINYMADSKIPLEEGAQNRAEDRDVLLSVTKLQVYAKCEMARRRGPFGRDPGSNDLVNLIVSQLSVGLKSSAAYLENIGAFEVVGQQIFPTLPENPAATAAPDGWTRTRFTVEEGTMYVNLVGLDPPVDINSGNVLLIAADRRRFVRDERINIGETIQKYTRLLSRVAKKLAPAIVPIDLSSGTGTCAQLVGSKDLEVSYTAERQAWCHRSVPQMSLVLGAGFQYGYNSADNWHVEDKKVAITGQISPCAFFTKLMQVNGKVPVGQVEAR